MLALMHLATTAWLACHPLRCVPALRLAYCSSAAGKRSPHPPRLAIVMSADVPLWKVNRRRPHVDELNRARKGPVFFWAEEGLQARDGGKPYCSSRCDFSSGPSSFVRRLSTHAGVLTYRHM